jgi:DNA-directed RNA polymerase specialized sigma24 family protein
MADRTIRDIMEQSIEELPDELRTAFVACVVGGMMPEQFAEFFCIDIGGGRGASAQCSKFAGYTPVQSRLW